MNEQQARNLKKWDRVRWEDNPNDMGVVSRVSEIAFYVKWDRAQWGWIHFEDASQIFFDRQATEIWKK